MTCQPDDSVDCEVAKTGNQIHIAIAAVMHRTSMILSSWGRADLKVGTTSFESGRPEGRHYAWWGDVRRSAGLPPPPEATADRHSLGVGGQASLRIRSGAGSGMRSQKGTRAERSCEGGRGLSMQSEKHPPGHGVQWCAQMHGPR